MFSAKLQHVMSLVVINGQQLKYFSFFLIKLV